MIGPEIASSSTPSSSLRCFCAWHSFGTLRFLLRGLFQMTSRLQRRKPNPRLVAVCELHTGGLQGALKRLDSSLL